MCGRFSLLGTPEEIAAYLALMELEAFPPRYNIAPTQPILMVIAGETPPPGSNRPDRRALLVRWGFIPGWVKDTANYPLMINARSETAIEKASFKSRNASPPCANPGLGFLRVAAGRQQKFASLLGPASQRRNYRIRRHL